jgi:transposase
MSQSLLYHGFGLKGVEYLGTEYKDGAVLFHIRTKDKFLKCGNCGSGNVIKKGVVQRKFKTVPIGLKEVFLLADIQRLQCKACGKIRQEKIGYADEKKVIPIA